MPGRTVLLLVLLAVAGCSGAGEPPEAPPVPAGPVPATTGNPTSSPPPYSPPPPPPVAATPPPPEVGSVPDSVGGYLEVCTGARFPGAAPYAGSRHPLFVYSLQRQDPRDPLDDDLDRADLGRAQRWTTDDVTKVQLVACVALRAGPFVRTCRYNFGYTSRLYRGDHTVEFREARTGRVVGRASARGADTSCAEGVVPNEDRKTVDHQYSDLTQAQADAIFAPYAVGPRR